MVTIQQIFNAYLPTICRIENSHLLFQFITSRYGTYLNILYYVENNYKYLGVGFSRLCRIFSTHLHHIYYDEQPDTVYKAVFIS